jgi:hypothetical protein
VCLPADCVSKLVVGVLQRRFDALLQAGARWLNLTYLVAWLLFTTLLLENLYFG